jgi:hypothetical protein
MIPIVGIRMGRPDYSGDVYIQPIPQLRGPLSTTVYRKEFFDVAPGQSVTFSDTFSPTHFIYVIDISSTTSNYFEFALIFDSNEYGFAGWGRITLYFPASYPITTFNAKITNRGVDYSNYIYCHYAILGVEQITPYFTPKPLP